MKHTLLVMLLTLGTHAIAETNQTHERVIYDQTEPARIDLHTARCSSRGYSMAELKVSVPDLAYRGIFNHVNVGETQPCITAGVCLDGNMPADLGALGATVETVDLRVQRVEVQQVDVELRTCLRSLQERVSATIRGKQFTHLRSVSLGDLPADKCD